MAVELTAAVRHILMVSDNSTFDDVNNQTGDDPEDAEDDYADKLTIVIFQIIFTVIGLLGNTLMFFLMRRRMFKDHSFSVYFSFAAVMDSLCLLYNCIMDSSEVLNNTVITELVAKAGACTAFELIESLVTTSSPLLMVTLTFDRFLSVKYPTKSFVRRYCRKTTAIFVCGGVLLVAVLIDLPMAILARSTTNDEDDVSEGPVTYDCTYPNASELAASLSYEVLDTIIPIILMSALNISLIRALRAARANEEATESDDQYVISTRFNTVIAYVLVMTLLTWIPLTLVEILSLALEKNGAMAETVSSLALDKAWHATLVIYLLTFVQNFYIFVLTSATHRSQLAQMLHFDHLCWKAPTVKKPTDFTLDTISATYKRMDDIVTTHI